MKLVSRLVASVVATIPLLLATGAAQAQETPCGKFDFFGDATLECKIQVEGGCKADCTPLKLEAGCYGNCTATADQTCVGSCGASCIAQCDPASLDCFVGCHDECDEPTKQACLSKTPEADCVNVAVAQCDIHCKDSCKVEPSNCDDHCNLCCTGGCTTQINYDCDYGCFADLQGGCEVQCDAPSGALFCNGQYIGADDVDACINYLAEQGVTVDVSARGSVTCDLSGCDGEGTAAAGLCAASNVGLGTAGAGGFGLLLVGLGVGAARRRRKARRG